ncbi:MAG: LacI family DNA-binding transcriptional regulator [Rhizobiaceae bacterium]|nr:LacI family DNA-binding transcriptional regulator [Rhizobiaceae bacterium]
MHSDGRKIRSLEVAERAQISRSTVSRVLSGDPRISEATRARVLAAADELGYQPNLIARGLKNQSTGIVGVVVTDLDNSYHAHALQLLIEKMGEKRLAPLVFAGNSVEGAESAIARLMSYQVDAVIALAAPFSQSIIAACRTGSKPLVLMNRHEGEESVSAVGGDGAAAGAMVADHLVARGARSFAFFGGDDSTKISMERQTGFADRLAAHSFSLGTVCTSRYSYDPARRAAVSVLSAAPDAVFCANDTLAMALADAARERDAGPPPMIVGYDNSALAARPLYDLTSVDQNLEEMTSRTVETALAMVFDSQAPTVRLTISPFLVERGSTRPRTS